MAIGRDFSVVACCARPWSIEPSSACIYVFQRGFLIREESLLGRMCTIEEDALQSSIKMLFKNS